MTVEGHPEPWIGGTEIELLQQLVGGQREIITALGKFTAALEDQASAIDDIGQAFDAFVVEWKAANTPPTPTQIRLVPGVPQQNV